jgi:hypothetical protein
MTRITACQKIDGHLGLVSVEKNNPKNNLSPSLFVAFCDKNFLVQKTHDKL